MDAWEISASSDSRFFVQLDGKWMYYCQQNSIQVKFDFIKVHRLSALRQVVGVEVGGGFRIAWLQELVFLKASATMTRNSGVDWEDLLWLFHTMESRGNTFEEHHPMHILNEVEGRISTLQGWERKEEL
jgi:hypothetical protein